MIRFIQRIFFYRLSRIRRPFREIFMPALPTASIALGVLLPFAALLHILPALLLLPSVGNASTPWGLCHDDD